MNDYERRTVWPTILHTISTQDQRKLRGGRTRWKGAMCSQAAPVSAGVQQLSVAFRFPRRSEAAAGRIQTAERGAFKPSLRPPIISLFSANRSLLMLDTIYADWCWLVRLSLIRLPDQDAFTDYPLSSHT